METTGSPVPGGGGGHRQCECQQSTSLLIAEINRTLEGLLPSRILSPPSSSSSPLHQQSRPQRQPVYLDGALVLSRRLVLEWESVNGCPNVEEHLRPATLLSIANAVEQVLKFYEVLLESTLATTSSLPRDVAAAEWSCVSTSSSSSLPGHVTMVPVTLGSMELDAVEARMVVHEALRHTITRLGDLLKDIEDESKRAAAHNVLEDVKRAQMLMFRLLGRVPR